jgi:hypothetical protein
MQKSALVEYNTVLAMRPYATTCASHTGKFTHNANITVMFRHDYTVK